MKCSVGRILLKDVLTSKQNVLWDLQSDSDCYQQNSHLLQELIHVVSHIPVSLVEKVASRRMIFLRSIYEYLLN